MVRLRPAQRKAPFLPCSPVPLLHCGLWHRWGWFWCPAQLQGCDLRSPRPSPELRPSWPPYLQTLGWRGNVKRIQSFLTGQSYSTTQRMETHTHTHSSVEAFTWPTRCSWLHQRTSSWQSEPTRSPGWRKLITWQQSGLNTNRKAFKHDFKATGNNVLIMYVVSLSKCYCPHLQVQTRGRSGRKGRFLTNSETAAVYIYCCSLSAMGSLFCHVWGSWVDLCIDLEVIDTLSVFMIWFLGGLNSVKLLCGGFSSSWLRFLWYLHTVRTS